MITTAEADTLANKTVQEYVNACHCHDEQDAANVLTKLASMCGLAMCALVGRADAVQRLRGTAEYIERTQEKSPWKRETVQ